MGPGVRRDDSVECALLKRLDLRRHIWRAADPVGRVAAFEDPDRIVRLGTLLVPGRTCRLVARKALDPHLRGQFVLRLLCMSRNSGGKNGGDCEYRDGA